MQPSPRRSRRLADRVVQDVLYDPVPSEERKVDFYTFLELVWVLFIFILLIIFYSFIVFS